MHYIVSKKQKLTIKSSVKKGVFSLRLKLFRVRAALSSCGREFHAVGPAKEKARSLNFVSSRGMVYSFTAYIILFIADNCRLHVGPCYTHGGHGTSSHSVYMTLGYR